MIIKLLFELVLFILDLLFGWVHLPAVPSIVVSGVNVMLDAISGAMDIVRIVIPRNFVNIVLPVVLILENFDKLYSITMWILKKIPFLGLK